MLKKLQGFCCEKNYAQYIKILDKSKVFDIVPILVYNKLTFSKSVYLKHILDILILIK